MLSLLCFLKAWFCFTTLLKIGVKDVPNKNLFLLSFNGSICNALDIKDVFHNLEDGIAICMTLISSQVAPSFT